MKEKKVAQSIYIDKELRDKIEALAKQEERSITAQIIYILKGFFKKEKP